MIIGLIGRARSGKDTFAELLAEQIFLAAGKRFILMAYAQELKLRVQKDFDLSYDQLWGDLKEIPDHRYRKSNVNNMVAGRREKSEIEWAFWTPREIMQAFGQFYRTIDTLFWVNNLFSTIEEKEFKNVIITDIRHPNEATPVSERNGYLIKVTSEREDKPDIHGPGHISETAMDDYDKVDFTVQNDGSIMNLKDTAEQVAKFILETDLMKEKNGG